MKTETGTTGWNDLIFENRNKDYGAYLIRESYDGNVVRGSLASLLFVAFLFLAAFVAMMIRPEMKKIIRDPFPKELFGNPKIITDKVAPKEMPKRSPKTNAALPPRVVTTDIVEPPPVETQTTSTVGTNGTGDPSLSKGTGVDLIPTTTDVVVSKQPFDFAEVMPEYEGGTKAMIKFLGKNIRYPRTAQSTGTEGTVFVRFVIDSDGRVVNIEIVKSAGALLDKEAIRVIALMNKWKPGRQNSMAVSVRMVLPVKFQLSE